MVYIYMPHFMHFILLSSILYDFADSLMFSIYISTSDPDPEFSVQ